MLVVHLHVFGATPPTPPTLRCGGTLSLSEGAWNSGGTADELPRERAKATFQVVFYELEYLPLQVGWLRA